MIHSEKARQNIERQRQELKRQRQQQVARNPYNDSYELIAIGKTAKPIKNDKEMALTFVVRFDTN